MWLRLQRLGLPSPQPRAPAAHFPGPCRKTCIPQPIERVGLPRLGCETAVFQRTERRKDIDLLIASAHAQARAPVWREMRHFYPRNKTLPALGDRSPDSILIKVVLPAPLGPMTACSSPTLDIERYVVDCGESAKILGQSAHLENRFNHSRSSLAEFESLRRNNRLWRSNKPANPSGRASTTTTIKLPIANCQCLA